MFLGRRIDVISRTFLLIAAFVVMSGCQLFERMPDTPIGYSTDENGRPCTTYETKSDRVYETHCDYSGPSPAKR